MLNNKIKILLIAPGKEAEGGIEAVIMGLEKCFALLADQLVYKRFVYGKSKRNMNTVIRFISEIYQFFYFIIVIFRFKPDIIHAQSSFDKKTIVRDSLYLWTTQLFNKKFILHAHGGEWNIIPNYSKIWQFYTNTFLKNCHQIIVTSSAELNLIKSLYSNTVNVTKINNVVHLDTNNIRKLEKPLTFKRIIFASRFIETKGILDAVKAMSFLKNRDDIKLQLYGNGPLLNEVKQLIETLDLKGSIELKGEVSFQELLEVYINGDAYLFPSYHVEGFPMAFFYAAVCGLPIISTAVRPIPDFLAEPSNCIYIESKNPKMIAEKITYLFENNSMMEEMRVNNKHLIVNFSVESISVQIMDIYQKQLS